MVGVRGWTAAYHRGADLQPARNEISSDRAFVMTEPNRRLAGIGFRSDQNMNKIQILKQRAGFAKA